MNIEQRKVLLQELWAVELKRHLNVPTSVTESIERVLEEIYTTIQFQDAAIELYRTDENLIEHYNLRHYIKVTLNISREGFKFNLTILRPAPIKPILLNGTSPERITLNIVNTSSNTGISTSADESSYIETIEMLMDMMCSVGDGNIPVNYELVR